MLATKLLSLLIGKVLAGKVLLIIVGMVVLSLTLKTAQCAGGSIPSELLKGEINGFSNAKGKAIVKRLLMHQPTEMQRLGHLHEEDVRNDLREDWQVVHNLASGGGQLPTANNMHELVQSLDNEAVSSALSVIKKKLGLYPWQQGETPAVPLGPHATKQVAIICDEIAMAAIGFTGDVTSLVGDLTEVAMQLRLPSPNDTEDQYLAGKAFFYLGRFLEETHRELPTFFTRYYGGKFQEKFMLLAYLYGRLFHFLPRDPELLFPQNEGISDRQREARIEEEADTNTGADEYADTATDTDTE